MKDSYRTIKALSTAEFVEQRSRFISFALPVETEEEALAAVEHYRKEYNDSRHVCWAYILGEAHDNYRANDDGEPSGTAGRPILGQIRSMELTNVIVLSVRYFGGIQLGTGGLVSAYQRSAREALENATIIRKMIGKSIRFRFDYTDTNDINHIINDFNAAKKDEVYAEDCIMTLEVPQTKFAGLQERLEKVGSIQFIDGEEDASQSPQ